MAYFPHAHKQLFVTRINSMVQAGKTDELTMGQYGFFDPKTWSAISTAQANASNHPNVVLALSSYHHVDKVGSHGGYQESLKSKPISPRNVHRFYKVQGTAPIQQVIVLGYDGQDFNAPSFDKGKQYLLRIDLKGSPALRFFGRNLYHTFDASSGCVDDSCTDPCGPVTKVDPVMILLQWAKQIKEDPIFSKFINPVIFAQVANILSQVNPDTYIEETVPADIAAIKAYMELRVAYIDTVFGNCSFDPRDHYELEPLSIYASLVDEGGDPCKIPYLLVRETTAAQSASGLGETILRDLILFNRYRQESFQLDPRRREIEDGEPVSTGAVNRSDLYDSYYLLYSVPRHANPSGMQDADQYLIQFSVPQGVPMLDFETWMQNYLNSAGSGVKLENLS